MAEFRCVEKQSDLSEFVHEQELAFRETDEHLEIEFGSAAEWERSQQQDFPDNHFDFVVCSAVLHHAVDMVQVLREVKRVLRPGGQLVAIREPVWPLIRVQSRSRTQTKLVNAGVNEHFFTLAEWRAFFARADFPLRVAPVNLAHGLKYWFNQLVNGLTHARYAFIATKPNA